MIRILDPGTLTTIQDGGRYGHLRSGIPPSGPMDRDAFVLANRLAGNDDNAAALECTLRGPRFSVEAACAIAITGAEMPVTVNAIPAARWATLHLQAGDIVKLGVAHRGVRGYIAVSGGIDVPLVLGSRATFLRGRLGGLHGRALRRDDALAIRPAPLPRARRLVPRHVPAYPDEVLVHVVLGPQHDRFTPAGVNVLLEGLYQVSPHSDRMGLRLEGPPIEHTRGADIVSDAIAAGSIQVPGNGQPIVLLADRQSTGGYTKIATVCSFDLARLGQLRPGQSLRFRAITVAAAHRRLAAADARFENMDMEDL